MTTCVFYIDESGHKGPAIIPIVAPHQHTPIFCLNAVALPLAHWRAIDREYLFLKNKFFKKEISKAHSRAERWEIKGNRLVSGAYADSGRNHYFIKAILDLIPRYDGKLFSCTTIKNPSSPINQTSLYTTSLQLLVERFNYFIQESTIYTNSIMILDKSTSGFDDQVAASHTSFIFGHETGRQLNCISEAPLFADSKLTSGLQIIDNISSMIYANKYEYHARKLPGAISYKHMEEYWPILHSLEFKSKNEYSGYRQYGFKDINHNL